MDSHQFTYFRYSSEDEELLAPTAAVEQDAEAFEWPIRGLQERRRYKRRQKTQLRQSLLGELVRTEVVYGETLRVVEVRCCNYAVTLKPAIFKDSAMQTYYIRPLRDLLVKDSLRSVATKKARSGINEPPLNNTQLRMLFTDLEALIELHELFLACLRERIQDDRPQQVCGMPWRWWVRVYEPLIRHASSGGHWGYSQIHLRAL